MYHLTERRFAHLQFLSSLAAIAPYCVASMMAGKGKGPKFDDFLLTKRDR